MVVQTVVEQQIVEKIGFKGVWLVLNPTAYFVVFALDKPKVVHVSLCHYVRGNNFVGCRPARVVVREH